jgi:hypothetical protein
MPLGPQPGPMPQVRAGSGTEPGIERASLLRDINRISDARGFQAGRSATVTRPLMVHHDAEGVDHFMGATIASRRHNAAEIALRNF